MIRTSKRFLPFVRFPLLLRVIHIYIYISAMSEIRQRYAFGHRYRGENGGNRFGVNYGALSSRCTRGKNLQLIRETFVSMNFRNEFTGMNITMQTIMKISFMYICFLSILLNFIKNKLISQRRVRTISFLGNSQSRYVSFIHY